MNDLKNEKELKSWLGCGLRLVGKTTGGDFRPEDVDGYMPLDPRSHSHVEYKFITILYLPVLPLGCYRVNSGNRAIIKKENWKMGEIMWVYVQTIITLICCLCFFCYAMNNN